MPLDGIPSVSFSKTQFTLTWIACVIFFIIVSFETVDTINVGKLLKKENLPKEEKKFQEAYVKAPSFLSIHVGVKADVLPPDTDCHHFILEVWCGFVSYKYAAYVLVRCILFNLVYLINIRMTGKTWKSLMEVYFWAFQQSSINHWLQKETTFFTFSRLLLLRTGRLLYISYSIKSISFSYYQFLFWTFQEFNSNFHLSTGSAAQRLWGKEGTCGRRDN